MKNIILLLSDIKKFIINLIYKRLKYKTKIVDTISFVNTKTKIYYNAKYIFLIL